MILDKIAADTKIRVSKAKRKVSFSQVYKQAITKKQDKSFKFEENLRAPGIHFICEVKKASPSNGVIAEVFPYLEIAKEYEAAGAIAVSCLTEPKYFLGSDAYLQEITQNVSIPVLRKDFTVDEYQIYEAKALGADVILLICALLDTQTVQRYLEVAHSLGMSAIVEVHDEEELDSAVTAGAGVIGINNRNLYDFTVDIDNSIRLKKLAPKDTLLIAESGIKTAEDVLILSQAGINGVLIGETLMRSDDKKQMLQELQRLI